MKLHGYHPINLNKQTNTRYLTSEQHGDTLHIVSKQTNKHQIFNLRATWRHSTHCKQTNKQTTHITSQLQKTDIISSFYQLTGRTTLWKLLFIRSQCFELCYSFWPLLTVTESYRWLLTIHNGTDIYWHSCQLLTILIILTVTDIY